MVVKNSQLQREIRQTRPFASPRHEAVLSVLKTADVLRAAIAATLEPAGITMQQYNVLRILRGAGDKGLPTLAIGERMIESAPGITRLLDRMEHKGWVSRARCSKDRRIVHARITNAGIALLAALDGPVNMGAASTLPELDDHDVRQLIHLLGRIRQGIAAGQAHHQQGATTDHSDCD